MFIYRKSGASLSNLAFQSALWRSSARIANYLKTLNTVVEHVAAVDGADRPVVITVKVIEAFADGDGGQTEFSIGETGTDDLFAAAALFADAPKGKTFILTGVLGDGNDLIVTGQAATGTGTGAIKVTSVVFPKNYGG